MSADTHPHAHKHGHGHSHTHDGIDWVARLADLRRADEANGPAMRSVANRLVESLPARRPTVLDIGCGAGGMSAALAEALVGRLASAGADTSGPAAGGTLVLVDAVPELLAAAEEAVRSVIDDSGADGSALLEVRTVRADLADDGLPATLPSADLVWASNVTHHLPDQRRTVASLAGPLASGGCLALAEGGLSMRCLPWDLGVGEPGLQDRLIAAHGTWFHAMRTQMPGSVRMPIGWNLALTEVGLTDVTSFTYLIDVPAPLTASGREAVVSWLTWMTEAAGELLDPADLATLTTLADPADAAFVGARDDVFMLKASTVFVGRRP
jgi:SAM-dependent methyltransferase